MFKKILTLALMFTGIATAFAQTPMPLNPAVKHGTLPNGLNYYLLHNEEPKNRANFYIAQKVGSTQENQEQLGLAHFLEHMAFNGTKNFPGKSMLEYLQNKGIRFGADINAYTFFDETVYNIDNVPCDDQALMDSVLLVLADWSGGILLEDAEIDAERGVIEEEWRSRDNANSRMATAMLPAIYQEFPYQHMVIGSIDVIRNFPYQVIRDYYHKWYRPDLQGIVIVGDFDVDAMEKKVVDLFSKIPMPENAAPREYPQVSDNKEPIYFAFQDPETQYSMAQIMFKSDVLPREMRNTMEGFMSVDVLQEVICKLINNRLNEYSKKPECRYSYAGVSMGTFQVSKTKDAFNIIVLGKDDLKDGMEDALQIVARACKTGFTDSELERVKSEILSEYEKAYNERNKTNTSELAQGIYRHFLDNTPCAGAEINYQVVNQIMPMLPVQAINQVASQIMTPENQVVVVQQPQTADSKLPEESVMVGTVAQAMSQEYEAYEDVKITEPLISKYNKPGKVTKTTQNADFGTTEMILSNGVKVIVKTTDFAADEIIMTAYRQGGKQLCQTSQASDVLLTEEAYESSKLGAFGPTMLQKYLAGKKVSLMYGMNNFTNTFQGETTVKDLETMMDLVYASFTALSADRESWDADINQARSILQMQDKNPQVLFSRAIKKAQYGNNPLGADITVADLDKANYDNCLKLIQESTANAADYTFVFVGNVDAETLKPMLEKYIASLPSKGKPTPVKVVTPMGFAHGDELIAWDQPMQNPATNIYDLQSDFSVPYNCRTDIYGSMVGEILGNVFTETIREEMGGAYSPSAFAYVNPRTGALHLLYVIGTNAEMRDAVVDRARTETTKLLENGASEEQFRKVKGAALSQYENSLRTNRYWMNGIMEAEQGWNLISGYNEALKATTLEDFNAFMKGLNFKDNDRMVIMTGVPEGK